MRSIASELLGVDVDEIARPLMLVAHSGLRRLQVAQPRQPGASEHPSYGALGHADRAGNARLGQAPATQLDDRQSLGVVDGSGTDLRTRGAVAQSGFTLGKVTTQPFACARFRDPVHGTSRARGKTLYNNVENHLKSTGEGESGILVDVHSAELLGRLVWLAPPVSQTQSE
jgi:hypothetical protein